MYDVFISFKNRDKNDNLTEDSKIAEKLYAELKNRRIEVFFSNHEIEEQGESQWRKSIDKALEEANTLVLIGTSLENINSPQVVYEWEQIFMEEIISRKNRMVESLVILMGLIEEHVHRNYKTKNFLR